MSNLKLGVEVVSARNLMPKDGQGSSSAFVELHFDGQKFCTTIKEKDLAPTWNENFYFNISDPYNLSNLTLDAYVYNNNSATLSKSFLGKVRITMKAFIPYSNAVVLHYPLEKQGIFSRVSGELGMKVFLTDDPYIKSLIPLPPTESSLHTNLNSTQAQTPIQRILHLVPNPFSSVKNESRHTFHHLPNSNHQQQQPHFTTAATQQPAKYGVDEMRTEPLAPKDVCMYPGSSSQPAEYALKETNPFLGRGQIVGGRHADKLASTYDLVELMQYLFVRVVKAVDLPTKDVTGSLDPYVAVRVGNYKGVTQHFGKKQNPEWNSVFAFSKDRIQSSVLEVVVMDKDMVKDEFVGIVRFDLHEIPTRVPRDSPLVPDWYRLEDKKGEKKKGELMLAVWIGTQADEAFSDAWLSDAASPVDISVTSTSRHIRSKVYHLPRLWYVRVNVVEVQDLVLAEKSRFPDVYVKAQIGNQVLKTKPVESRTMSAMWNEDLMFVAAEPFNDYLILSVEDRMGPNNDEILGEVTIPLNSVEKRADDRIVHSKWFKLRKPSATDVEDTYKDEFATRLHLCVCLDGGYHVLDESTRYCSDLQPTVKQLWKPSIGVLELGILNAHALHPMKTREGRDTTDIYCVAKYGHKWVRSRTIIDSLNPKYNEQYSWEVYDTATVLTVGVFDNSQLSDKGSNGNKDVKIGKVQIRLSTLETGRVYAHSYPLLVLHPSGVKKMGELHLAIRFSCTSMVNMMFLYSRPLLPKMNDLRPLTVMQLEYLSHQAVNIVAARLSREEPPLRPEVIEYMMDGDSYLWSMRRSKANLFRLTSVFNGLLAVAKWFEEVCMWRNPITTVLVHVLFMALVCFPKLILPTVFLYMFLIGLWNYRFRPKAPPHKNTRISYADAVHPEELDEEFDTFPTRRSNEMVRNRYDRLRIEAARIQTLVGDIASEVERIHAVLNWRDPRATFLFVTFYFMAAIVLYVMPFQLLIVSAGLYVMRHPWFRHKLPSAPLNFFRRLPTRTDCML